MVVLEYVPKSIVTPLGTQGKHMGLTFTKTSWASSDDGNNEYCYLKKPFIH